MKKLTLKHQPKRILTTLFSMLIYFLAFAQAPGSFRGKIIDRTTKQPISGVSVRIDKTSFGAVTDPSGSFAIAKIPAGTYSVTISAMGFQTKNISEIEISHNKAYYSEIELLEEAKKLDEVTVKAIRYKGENNPMTPVSTYSYSREEIFRNPGAQGDIMRALSSLPGVVSSGAQLVYVDNFTYVYQKKRMGYYGYTLFGKYAAGDGTFQDLDLQDYFVCPASDC